MLVLFLRLSSFTGVEMRKGKTRDFFLTKLSLSVCNRLEAYLTLRLGVTSVRLNSESRCISTRVHTTASLSRSVSKQVFLAFQPIGVV